MADTEEVDEYEVERILAEDVVDGQILYLVKWEGYLDEECTWEPADSFTSQTSITAWEEQKKSGLGLDDEFLALVQERMDNFQSRGERPNQLQAETVESDSTSSTKDKDRPKKKKQKKMHDTDDSSSTMVTPVKTIGVQKKGIAVPAKDSNQKNSARPLAKRTTKPSKVTGGTSSVNATEFQKAGQRFRNLSHMNNYRKKAREEPPPSLPPGALKPLAEFDIGREAAHILPPLLERNEQVRNDSPLFIPDTSGLTSRRDVSPPISESSVFPPPGVRHAESLAKEKGKSSENVAQYGMRSDDRQITSPNIGTSRTKSEGDSGLTTTSEVISIRSIPLLGFKEDPPSRIPPAETPAADQIRRARNGRWWYHGDVVCHFSMGRPIGVANITHVPYLPFGSSITHLKIGTALELDFGSTGLNRYEFEHAFTNHYIDAKAIGLVCPFDDAQKAFSEFAEYLETHDSAAVLQYRDRDAEYSLVLYSMNSTFWRRKYGWKPARTGEPRLHLAFLSKLIPRQQTRPQSPDGRQPTNPVQIVNTENAQPKKEEEDASSSLQKLQRIDTTLSRQRTRSPSLSCDVSTMSIRTPISPTNRSDPFTSLPQSPWAGSETLETLTTALSPQSPGQMQSFQNGGRRQRLNACQPDTEVAQFMQAPGNNKKSQIWRRLDYKYMVSSVPPNAKFDKAKARIFISFGQSDPNDAKAVQAWLEKKIEPSNIYLDSERFDWVRFKEKASDMMSVLLFHESHPNYHRLSGLGSILSLDHPNCFSISFTHKANGEPDLESTLLRRLFPRMTAYLVTETMIIRNLEETMILMRYFNSTKKPGYKVIMRPNVERWLLEYASKIKDDTKRGLLIELLIMVRSLQPTSDILEEFDVNGDAQMTDIDEVDSSTNISYITSPSEISAYDEVQRPSGIHGDTFYTAAPSLQDIRDDILRSYFFAYAATHPDRARRFIAFYNKSSAEKHLATLKQKEKDNSLECGHIAFFELEKFVAKYCHQGTGKKRDRDGEKKAQRALQPA